MSGRTMIDVSGTTREYILTVPAGYDPSYPYRLIFAFHGRMYSAESVADGGPPGSGPYYGIQSLANGSTIFIAPQALDTSWTNQNGRDIAYVSAMLAKTEADFCIDQNRVFATGFSMGAVMTISIGCSQAAVFRAIAPMSGELPTAANAGTCDGNHPIAYWASHGTSDPTIPIANGQAARDEFRSRNHCSTQTTPGDREGCVDYQGCDPGSPTTWCTFAGVHEPPPYAGEAIWAFLSRF
jgi:poly(3-hydroxybutyrate) depolymerase